MGQPYHGSKDQPSSKNMAYLRIQQRHTIFPYPGDLLAISLVTGLTAIKFCLAGLIEKLGNERLWRQDLDPTVP